ncbi:MAG: alanine racemase [Acidobacteriaceae bacterium]|nr:alanine racemase [Acidobacteriaceae bacterium]
MTVSGYELANAAAIPTPALLIYRDIVEANIAAAIRLAGDDPNRWRPHVKTFKSTTIIQALLQKGISAFKCATTLELLTCCSAGAPDTLLAFPVVGANAARVLQIAQQFPHCRISVLIESEEQLRQWLGTQVGVFIDVNPGMNRTGIVPERTDEIVRLSRLSAAQFRGLHYYDGQIAKGSLADRTAQAQTGYERLLTLRDAVEQAQIRVREIITSGTPASPAAISYQPFRTNSFLHRISPGTVVLNDLSSLEQLPGFGFAPAALVLSTVVSYPAPGYLTCDAGHKSVSADAGVPTCAVLGHPELVPLKPSEEHLPIQATDGARVPAIGDQLYILPRHVCPTVNLFDTAIVVANGRAESIMPISARGHDGTSV